MAPPGHCQVTQQVAMALDASSSSEPTFLLSSEGDVIHKNPFAMAWFNEGGHDGGEEGHVDGSSMGQNVTFLLSFQDRSWEDVTNEFLSGTGGEISCSTKNWHPSVLPSRASANGELVGSFGQPNVGTLSLLNIGPCPCCNNQTDRFIATLNVKGRPGYVGDAVNGASGHEETMSKMQLVQQTVDASFDAMFSIDATGVILMANAAAVNLFGWTREEFVGQNISMICGGGHAERHDGYIQKYLRTGNARIIGKKREVPARKRDGTEFLVELGIKEVKVNEAGGGTTTKGVDDGRGRFFCAFIKDLSDQKEYEKELKLRESLTQAVLNSSFDPMFQINDKGIICLVNKAAVALFGWSKDEFVGSNISIICGGEHGARHSSYLQRYLETGEKHIIGSRRPTVAKRKDGTEFEIELGVQEVVTDGGERHFCGYIRDLTRQNMEKFRLRHQESLIKDEFFGSSPTAAESSPKAAICRVGSQDSSDGSISSGRRPNRPLRRGRSSSGGSMSGML